MRPEFDIVHGGKLTRAEKHQIMKSNARRTLIQIGRCLKSARQILNQSLEPCRDDHLIYLRNQKVQAHVCAFVRVCAESAHGEDVRNGGFISWLLTMTDSAEASIADDSLHTRSLHDSRAVSEDERH